MIEAKVFLRYLKTLENLAQALESAAAKYTAEPQPNSQAAHELEVFAKPIFLEIAFGQGAMLTKGARDHFRGLVRSLAEPVLSDLRTVGKRSQCLGGCRVKLLASQPRDRC